jgi:hypothetical protein
MPDREVLFSRKEDRDVEAYAKAEGVTPEEAIKNLAMDNLRNRLKSPRTRRGEVRTFQLPER